jgi:predicted nucleic acid-binding protein
MRRVFADSYYFIALISRTDPKHDRAFEFATTFLGELITTAWILTELGDGLARPPRRAAFVTLCDRLAQNPSVHVVGCSDELFAAGLERYRSRKDKSWSLTDCISFVVMERERIAEALTGDHHFEQAGFVALLK